MPASHPLIARSFATLWLAGFLFAGMLLLLTLIRALPEWRRFFTSERWGGYAASGPAVDAVLHLGLGMANAHRDGCRRTTILDGRRGPAEIHDEASLAVSTPDWRLPRLAAAAAAT